MGRVPLVHACFSIIQVNELYFYHLQVGVQASAWVSVGVQVGDEVEVRVEEAHPRDDVLSLKEVVKAE